MSKHLQGHLKKVIKTTPPQIKVGILFWIKIWKFKQKNKLTQTLIRITQINNSRKQIPQKLAIRLYIEFQNIKEIKKGL